MLSKFSIKRPVTTVMAMLIVVLGGLVAYFSLNLDLMPAMDIPVAIVSTSYSGAGPEEIETLITKPVEEALGSVANIDTLSSTSSAGSSVVVVMFEDGTDIDLAAVDMREKVDMIKGFLPDGAGDPMVLKMDIASMTAIYVGIKSDTLNLTELNTLTEDTLVRRFEKIEGVTSVSVMGGLEEEIQVVVSPEKMQGYGISTNAISQVLSSENLNYPVGSVEQGSSKMQVKLEGKFNNIEEIRDLPITTPGGSIIHLRDVADINFVEKDLSSYAIIDGEAAIMLTIQKQSNANIVEISDKVNKEMSKVQRDYSQIDISMLSDTSSYIKISVGNIVSTAVQAAVLAILVIFVFLRSPKMSLIIGISIPTSIIATFAAMWVFGMTMNMISMGGIAIGIGMLVDNSIVVLENIFSHMKRNPEDPKGASAQGASEVAMAVTASTLTTMGVFVPLMFASGTIGSVFKDLSLTICFSLLASLAVSLTFVPMACSKLLKPEMFAQGKEISKGGKASKILDAWGRGIDKLSERYNKLLQWCLINKKKVVGIVCAIFVGTLALLPIMGFDFMPEMDEGVVSVTVQLPKGSVIEQTEGIVAEVVDVVSQYPEVDNFYAMIGGGGMGGSQADNASIVLNLVGKKDRDISSKDMAKKIEDSLASIAGCEISVSASSMAMGSYAEAGVTVRLSGDESDLLRQISFDIDELLMEIEGVTDVTGSGEETLPEAKIIINREKASIYGVSAGQISNAISGAINGSVATQLKVSGSEVDVRIKQSKDSVRYLGDLKNITVMSQSGVSVPITEVAEVVMDESSVDITRTNHRKYSDITAVIYGRDMRSVQLDIEEKLETYIMPDGYSYEFTGTLEDMNESFMQLLLVLVVAILLVYMIMASQFESLIYPFIVMFSMPIAITGGIFGLFVTGKSITIVSFMGFIMLVGMVVNNAIVLVDAANQNVEKGMSAYEAISKAGPDRLQPILMTTLTTVLGMIPLGMALSEGMEMQQPMAIAIIFGLTLSTFVTLIFIPVLYLLVDKYRIKNLKKMWANGKNSKKSKKAKQA